jgi:protoheme IX farnesyltransferase
MNTMLALPRQKIIWQDYLALIKPRAVLLHLITAAAAMFLASKGFPPEGTFWLTLLGGGLVAGSSNVFNCYFDRDVDSLMSRTKRRPLPSGRLSPNQALVFGLITSLAGLSVLTTFAGWVVALLAMAALVYYDLVYTLLLKRRTRWSAVIGSGAGAFPPIIGWVAVTGQIGAAPFLLFAIVALWSPPHFWSLAIFRQQDYQAAGLGAIPARNTPGWIICFSILLVVASLSLVPVSGMGLLYSGVAASLNTALLFLAVRFQRKECPESARRLFVFSIIYLVVLFMGIIADQSGHF